MPCDDDRYKRMYEDIISLYDLIRQNTNDGQFKEDLSRLDLIVDQKIPSAVYNMTAKIKKQDYIDFKSRYEMFKDCVCYRGLERKQIVAIGGNCFSSRVWFQKELLEEYGVFPKAIETVTVPVYVMHGEKAMVQGSNVLDQKINMNIREHQRAADIFERIEIENRYIFRSILKNICFGVPFKKYKNLALFNVPSCSISDDENEFLKMSHEDLWDRVNSCDRVCWFFGAEDLEKIKSHVKHLRKIREDMPKVIIVEKGNVESLEELEEILERIRFYLDVNKVTYQEILSFSSNIDRIGDGALREFINVDMEKLREKMNLWNDEKTDRDILHGFVRFFSEIEFILQEEIHEKEYQERQLNVSLADLITKNIDKELLYPFQREAKGLCDKIQKSKHHLEGFRTLKREFFLRVTELCEKMQICIPELSEIKGEEKKVLEDPLSLIQRYKKMTGKETDYYIPQIIKSVLEGVKPTMKGYPGGCLYEDRLVELLKKNADMEEQEKKFNEVTKKVPEFVEIMKQI